MTLHGGSVAASSPGPGQGSTFTVRLPLAGVDGTAGPDADGAAAQAGTAPSTALRILVADDNVDAADTLAYLLRLAGHEVRVAYDGEEAVRIGTDFLPELAFLDMACRAWTVARPRRRCGRGPGCMACAWWH